MKKRILGIALPVVLVLGVISGASATDIKIKGYFDFAFGWYSNAKFYDADQNDTDAFGSEENFDAGQRLRFQIDFVASDQLSGTVQLEIGNVVWGRGGGDTWGGAGAGNGRGGAMGADGVNVETKHMYIDWIVPETDLSIRMGILPFALPNYANGALSGNAILDDDMTGMVASYSFNEYVAANLAWLRPWNPFIDDDAAREAYKDHDNIDLFALTLPLTFADYGLQITPWAMYGSIGEVNDTRGWIGGALSNTGFLGQDGNAWWAGFSFNLTYWDPFFFAFDFMYGAYTSDSASGTKTILGRDIAFDDIDNDRDGWAFSAKAGYKLEYMTPTLFGWYGSGAKDGDEVGYDGIMPVLSPNWGFTSFGWSNNYGIFREGAVNGRNITGTWGIGLGFENIKLLEGLSNNLRVAYFQGTNDSNGLIALLPFMARVNPAPIGGYLYTTDDWGLEVNLDSVYNIMEGLDLYNQIGYIHAAIDGHEDLLGGRNDNKTDDAWEFAVGFRYTF